MVPRPPGRVYLLALANLSVLGSLTAPAVAGLALRVSDLVPPEDRVATLAFLVTCGGLAALLANPVFGALSDRTRGRWGRRRPWMLAGVVGGGASILAISASDSLVAVTASWMAAQICYNATLAAVQALLAESVSEPERAASSGVFAAATFLGTVPPLVLLAAAPGQVAAISAVMPIVAVLSAVLCAVVIREGPPPLRAARRRRFGLDVSEAPGFVALAVQRTLFQLGLSLMLAFTLYFVVDRMSLTQQAATSIASITTVIGGGILIVAATVTGFRTARRGNYTTPMAIALGSLALAAALRAFAPHPALLWASAAVGGFGAGVFYATDLALALRIVPARRAGTYFGVLNLTETIPQVTAPTIAVFLLSIGGSDPVSGGADNYTVLYLAAAVVSLAALAVLPFLGGVLRRSVLTPAAPP